MEKSRFLHMSKRSLLEIRKRKGGKHILQPFFFLDSQRLEREFLEKVPRERERNRKRKNSIIGG